MERIFPAKLRIGDEVRVIAPANSLAIISSEVRRVADERFAALGLKLTFGIHVEEIDDASSSSIASRVEDLHEAFSDQNVKAVIPVIGGYNSNQLLRHIDWDLVKNNPKVFCGYSDITALNAAILAKTGLVTYSGPCYSTFGQQLHFDYTLDCFRSCVFSGSPLTLTPSKQWSDDAWYKDQQARVLMENSGPVVINGGQCHGPIIGTNLCTLNLLQGTEYFPSLRGAVVFIEDDEESSPQLFDRDLQSLCHLPDFPEVKGVVIGRFQKASQMSNGALKKIIGNKKELEHIPVIANVDFGHTSPLATLPIGGECEIDARGPSIVITKH